MKKCLLLFGTLVALPCSLCPSAAASPLVSAAPVNAAPPSFPSTIKVFENIYAGKLSLSDAQTQPWFESYDTLYKKVHSTAVTDNRVTTLLTKLAQKVISPTAADAQFQEYQNMLVTQTNNLFVPVTQ